MELNKKKKIEIYCDGSATQADLPGGWAFRVVADESSVIYEKSGHMLKATNNDAELEAALQGLLFIKNAYEKAKRDFEEDDLHLVCDSQIVLGWASGQFRVRQEGKAEKVRHLKHLVDIMGVNLRWVKGHSDDQHNIRCDKLAKKARKGILDIEAEGVRNPTEIGMKKKGTLAIRYKEKRFVIDLESLIIEEYDRLTHGHREICLQVVSDEKS